MRFQRLRIEGVRCLQAVDIAPAAGINLLLGPNGAGKTSVLESAYLLSHARSFRSGPRDVMKQRGVERMHIYGEIVSHGRTRRLGLGHGPDGWHARVDGVSASRLGDLFQHGAVVCFEPGSHALVAGAADERRRFLDWGVFHVEHRFLAWWQRYRRALKQRNALLRQPSPVPDAVLTPWEVEMGEVGDRIDAWRRRYLQRLEVVLQDIAERFLPELGRVAVTYRPGWEAGLALADALTDRRDRDRDRGHSTVGAHRADWRPVFEHAPQREHLSRGQEKLCALACHLAQARLFADDHGEWPVICLDDLASELDAVHRSAVVEQLLEADAQVFITGTERPDVIPSGQVATFHVEHDHVTPAAAD